MHLQKMDRDKLLEAAKHLVKDLEMLKDGTWVPDKHSINASLANADLLVEQLTPAEKQFCCDECGSDDIEWMMWADENNEISDAAGEERYVYCNNCGEPGAKCIEKTNYKP